MTTGESLIVARDGLIMKPVYENIRLTGAV